MNTITLNPRFDIETILFKLFLEEKTVSEMMCFVRDTQFLELGRDDVVTFVRSHLNKLPGDISEEQKLTIARLAKMLRSGLVNLEQPITPFLDDILEVLNEQALELSIKSSRDSNYSGKVMITFLDTIKFLVELKKELEGVVTSVDYAPVVMSYNFEVCKVFVDSIESILPGEENTDTRKKLMGMVMEKIDVLLKTFVEKYSKDAARNTGKN